LRNEKPMCTDMFRREKTKGEQKRDVEGTEKRREKGEGVGSMGKKKEKAKKKTKCGKAVNCAGGV